jgi:non-homologous end joining protein Ku
MKSYVSSFTIHLGPVTTTGRLVAVRLPKPKSTYTKPQLKYVSPDGNPVEQRYRDVTTGEIYEVDALSKGTATESGSMIVVDEQALQDANVSLLPKDVMNVTVHDATEVEGSIFPADSNAYVFYPKEDDPTNKGWADFVTAALTEAGGKFAFLGNMNLRNSEGMFRLSIWRGHLIVQKQLYPGELNDHNVKNDRLSKNIRSKAVAAVASLVQPFDPDEYKNDVAERLSELVSETEANGGVAPKKAGAASLAKVAQFDLDSALDEMFK